MKRVLLSITILSILFAAVPTNSSLAAPAQGIAISPPTFELSANPGDTIKNSIRVDNLTDQQISLTVDRKNFTALGEEGEVNLTEDESSFSLASWIVVSPDAADIPPKESKIFTFSIKVPSNAEPGGRFGSIVFKTIPKPIVGQSGLSVGQELGALILLSTAGKVTERTSIQSFDTKGFREYGPVTFKTRLKNEGNVHLKPTGTITITDFFGRKVATVPIDPRNILPGAVRKVDTPWAGNSLFGKYTATLSLQYGANHRIITASTTFVVIPYRLVLMWLVVLVILGTLIYRGRKRLHKSIRILFGKE